MTPLEDMTDTYYNEAEYRTLGGYTEVPSITSFLFRFAPPKIGKWTCTIKIILPNNELYQAPPFLFEVIESGSPGYVSVSQNKRYLELGAGETFYPVGCNAGWPQTHPILDPEFAAKNGNVAEEYRGGIYSLPRVYDVYKGVLNDLIDGGANCIRTIMYPTATDIEFEKLGDYTDRLHMAQEMDEILELFENKGALMDMNLQIHYSLCFAERVYGHSFTWDTQVTDKYGTSHNYCYKDLPGIVTPIDFLDPTKNAEVKKYYKQRLRYILARWGYSTNIAWFEILSEGNLIIPSTTEYPDNSDFYFEGDNWKILSDWNKEMAAYIKSQYNGKIHLVTTGYAGTKKAEDNTFYDDNFDLMSLNYYDYAQPSNGNFLIDVVNKVLLNERDHVNCYTWHETGTFLDRKVKPLIFSETGILDIKCGGFLESQQDFSDELRLIYQIPFSGLAGGLSWDMWYHKDKYYHFQYIKDVIYDVPRLSTAGWHPGAMNINEELYPNSTAYWYYDDDLELDNEEDLIEMKDVWMSGPIFDENGDTIRNRKADLSYLRSADRNMAAGIITNKTINFLSNTDCFHEKFELYHDSMPQYWPGLDDFLLTPSHFDGRDEQLYVKGLHNNKNYYTTYHQVYDLDNFNLSQFSDENEIWISPNVNNLTIAFKSRWTDILWEAPTLEDSIARAQNELNSKNLTRDEIKPQAERSILKIYPNPTDDLLTIELPVEDGAVQLTVLDLSGKIVLKKQLSLAKQELDIKILRQGTYIFEIVNSIGEMQIFKVDKL